MSVNNKGYRTMDDETRAMVQSLEKQLLHAQMEYQEAKNQLHNAKRSRSRYVSRNRKPEPGGKYTDLERVIEERAEAFRLIEEKRKAYLIERGLY
jgi:hypothetical protein